MAAESPDLLDGWPPEIGSLLCSILADRDLPCRKFADNPGHQVSADAFRCQYYVEHRGARTDRNRFLSQDSTVVYPRVHEVHGRSRHCLAMEKHPETGKKPRIAWEQRAMQVDAASARKHQQPLLEDDRGRERNDQVKI